MRYFYDLIFLLFSIIYLPYLLIKGKAHKDFIQRFGVLPKHLKGIRKDTIWVHTVSVGEVLTSESLIQRLKEAFPEQRIILSTTTITGNQAAKKIYGESVPRFYFPLDFHFIIDKTVNFINPLIFILFETEIWPNLIIGLSKRKIPVILANGRISDRSFKGYKLIRFILAKTLKKIDCFLMQTEEDAERLRRLGAPAERVKVCGNVKYDVRIASCVSRTASDFNKEKLGIVDSEELIVCGSTHKGEEEIILKVYKELLNDFNNLRLLIAPRHVDRADDIERLCRKFGFESMKISEIIRNTQYAIRNTKTSPQPILILDTIGQLAQLYQLATIVFMGGSLINRGGHNLVEPARFAKAIVFGPHMHNFRDMKDQLLRKKASIMVKDRNELKDRLKSLLKDKSKITEIGRRAAVLVEENKGAIGRIIGELKQVIS